MKNPASKTLGLIIACLLFSACSSGGSTRVSYGVGVGYGGYYGAGPWRGYSGYPVYVGGGRPDIPDIPQRPSAAQLPDFGMPGGGMMDAGPMDFGDFDF